MRRFTDEDGRSWEVVLGRASWGAHAALFVPVGHDAPVRQADLTASSLAGAMDEIEGKDEAALRALLAASKKRDE